MQMAKKGGRLLEFYGTECTHCNDMAPTIEQFEAETGLKIEKIEIWHNEQNSEYFQECDDGFCGGVPFFFNEKTSAKLCGEQDLAALKSGQVLNK